MHYGFEGVCLTEKRRARIGKDACLHGGQWRGVRSSLIFVSQDALF
ncbi:MAG: hypothetical protein ACTJHY_07105 [Alcaligenes pakistanensis]